MKEKMLLFFQNNIMKYIKKQRIEIYDIIEECNKMFNLEINFIFKSLKNKSYLRDEAYTSGANYNPSKDMITINDKHINYLYKHHSNDFNSLIKHLIIHELGHAKDAREFKKKGVYPYTLRKNYAMSSIIEFQKLKK